LSQFLSDDTRRVVPRWRDSRTTAAIGELRSLGGQARRLPSEDTSFDEKLQEWQDNHAIATATELVGAAFVLGREGDAEDAAQYLLSQDLSRAPAIQSIATKVLQNGSNQVSVRYELLPSEVDQSRPEERINALRFRLRTDPRNAIAWADLAREYAVLGLHEKAEAAIRVGVALAPGNRFILRSAARLYIHRNKPERAHHLLLRSPATHCDPWLLSAEITVAAVAGRTSRLIKTGRQVLQDTNSSAFDTTELASALATLELSSGQDKIARRLFRQSLRDPTENAVAQAGWAARRLPGLEVDVSHFGRPRSFEARTWRDHYAGEWQRALKECERWLNDEAFSSRPAVMGSYLASVALQDFAKSAEFAGRGLIANPDDVTLLNNLCVAQTNLGQLREAQGTFGRIRRQGGGGDMELTLLATEGLLRFRQGDVLGGRNLYTDAIEKADERKQGRVKALALAHLAREELLANTGAFERVFALAVEECKKYTHPELVAMIKRLEDAYR
jgi:tetratricopeptide (TPR) repeat protein